MKSLSIQNRVFNNVIVGSVSFAVTFGQTIILVPILLNYWGNEVYGVWLSLFAGFSLLQTLDLGHQNYVGNKFNLLYHENKYELKKVLGSSLLIAYLLGLLQVTICLVLIFSNALDSFLGVSIEFIAQQSLGLSLLVLMLMWFSFGSVGGILIRLLIPAGMLYQSQWWGIVIKLTQFISLVIIAILGEGILVASIMFSIVQSIISFFIYIYIKNKLPEFYPWWRIREWKEGFKNFKKSLVLTTNGIAQQLGNNGLILFISNFLQISLVPVFTTIRTLTNTALSITNVFISSLLPDIIKFHAKGENKKIIIAQNANWFITGVVVNSALLIVLPFIEMLYNFWTKGLLQFNLPLFLLLVASISFSNFGAGLYQYLVGINHLVSQSIITVTRVLIIFIFSFMFLGQGLIGLGIGLLVAEIVCSVLLPIFFVNKQLNSLNTCLDNRFIFISLLPPIIILLTSIYFIIINELQLLVIIIPLLLLAAVYFFNWSILDDQIKLRLADLRKTIFKFSLNEAGVK